MALSSRIDRIRSHFGREKAQTMAEYAVVLAVITPVIVVTFALFSEAIVPLINRVVGFLT